MDKISVLRGFVSRTGFLRLFSPILDTNKHHFQRSLRFEIPKDDSSRYLVVKKEMAEHDPSFLHSRMLDPLDSPGPIPVEYSRQSQSLTADILETNRLAGLHPTTAWRPEIQTSQARAALLTSEEFHLMSRFSFQPNSMPNTAQRSFFTGLQGSVSDRHMLEMANEMRQAQQEENRHLQAPQLRVDTPHVQNNGNQFPLQGRHSLPFTMGQQAEAQQIYQTSQPQPHSQIQSMGQDMQRSISQQGLQQSESRASTSESRKERPSVKHLTCWWWNEKGKCKYTVDECLYAHHKTGRVADAPRQVKAGGKSLSRLFKLIATVKRADSLHYLSATCLTPRKF